MDIYLHRNGAQYGPYSLDVIHSMREKSEFVDGDLLWDVDDQSWKSVEDFFQKGQSTVVHVPPPKQPPPLPENRNSSRGLPEGFEKKTAVGKLEDVYHSDSFIEVSKTRFVVGNQTYAMAGITSIRTHKEEAAHGGSVGCILAGLIVGLLGVGAFLGSKDELSRTVFITMGSVMFLCGILLCVLGVNLFKKEVPKYMVIIRTSAGELQVFSTPNEQYARKIAAALNIALIARG